MVKCTSKAGVVNYTSKASMIKSNVLQKQAQCLQNGASFTVTRSPYVAIDREPSMRATAAVKESIRCFVCGGTELRLEAHTPQLWAAYKADAQNSFSNMRSNSDLLQ